MIGKAEILEKLTEMKGRLKDLSFSDKTYIERTYEIVFRRVFTRTSCGDCYRDAVIEMYTYLQKNEIMEKKSNYTLKAGVVLQSADDANVYTNINLTDETAEKYLKSNSNRISLFEAYPQDWEERTKDEEPEEYSEAENEFISLLAGKLKEGSSKNSLKEEFKEFEIDGKKVTQRAMTAYLKAADELNK